MGMAQESARKKYTDYRATGGRLGKIHADFTGVEEFDWARLANEGHSATQRERGRRSFILRALDEQRSLLAFSELLAELAEQRAPIDVIGSLSRVVRDEARHVDLCGRVVDSLGGFGSNAPDAKWVRSDKRLPLRRRVLKTIVGSLCVGETISVSMIRGVRDNATDVTVHAVLTQMLSDESFHSRFGWWWLEQADVTDKEREWVNRYLTKLLPAVERGVRPSDEKLARNQDDYVYSPFGSMKFKERDAAFDWAMHDRVIPSFDKLGFDATAIWKAHKAAQQEKAQQEKAAA